MTIVDFSLKNRLEKAITKKPITSIKTALLAEPPSQKVTKKALVSCAYLPSPVENLPNTTVF